MRPFLVFTKNFMICLHYSDYNGADTIRGESMRFLTIIFPPLLATAASGSDRCAQYPSALPIASAAIGLIVLGIVGMCYVKLRKCGAPKHKNQDELDEIRHQEEHLLQQSRLAQMGEMVSMIAHQWRQPLGAIASTAIGIETKIRLQKFDFTTPEGIEQAQRYLLERTELIAGYVNALTTTIDDFRTFYQKDKAKEYLPIQSAVQRALAIIQGTIDQGGITVELSIDSRSDILLYPNEIVQVILNLLQNACDQFKEHHAPNPRIGICAFDADGGVTIEISDNAGGIPDEILPKIFRPYFSTKENKNGTGIGLYMSKIIVEDHHNGRLSGSNRVDGACFTLHIPLDKGEHGS